MGRRVLTVRQIVFHEKWKQNGKVLWPYDLLGQDFLEIFRRWAVEVRGTSFVDSASQRWLCVRGGGGVHRFKDSSR